MYRLLIAILEKASLKVVSIRASMSIAEKAAAIAAFNDGASKIDVCVVNKRYRSAGINYHNCCHRGIQVQYDWNIGSQVQGQGRLTRIGQKSHVIWTILRVNDTAYDFYEFKALEKERRSLETVLDYPKWLEHSSSARRLIAYEVLRVTWAHPFHRYVWEIHHPKEIQDFNSAHTRNLAKFSQHLATMLLSIKSPPLNARETLCALDGFIDVVGMRWLQGLEIGQFSRNTVSWTDLLELIQQCDSAHEWVKEIRQQAAKVNFGSSRKRTAVFDTDAAKARKKAREQEEEAGGGGGKE